MPDDLSQTIPSVPTAVPPVLPEPPATITPPVASDTSLPPTPPAPPDNPPFVSPTNPPIVPPAPAGSKKIKIGLAIAILFLVSVSIPAAVWLTSQRQETRKMAQGSVTKSCIGREVIPNSNDSCTENQKNFYGILVTHTFESEAACRACESNQAEPTCQGAYLVGQLTVCGNGATCTQVGQCTTDRSDGAHCVCDFSQNIPPCSVVQLDCSNDPYPPGGGISGTIAWNCAGPCGSPTNTPVPTPTATPPVQNTPTPTSTLNPSGTPRPTATPTQPTSHTISCLTCKAYDTNWNQITPNSIQLGQTVYFATLGSTNYPGGITQARFRINSGNWQVTTNKHDNLFYIQYTVASAGSYTIESMVFNPTANDWY